VRRATFLASVRADLLDILTYVAETIGSVAIEQAFVSELRAQCRHCERSEAIQAIVGRPSFVWIASSLRSSQ
jgi:hypothetical protein